MTTTQVKRLKELEKENLRLRRAVSDLTLDKLILQEAAKGNYLALIVAVTVSKQSRSVCLFLSVGPAKCLIKTVRCSATR